MRHGVLCYTAGADDDDVFGDFNVSLDDDFDAGLEPLSKKAPQKAETRTGVESSFCRLLEPAGSNWLPGTADTASTLLQCTHSAALTATGCRAGNSRKAQKHISAELVVDHGYSHRFNS